MKALISERIGLITPLYLALLAFCSVTTLSAHDDDWGGHHRYYDRDGYWDGYGHYHHFEYYHHHRGYWEERNGFRIWINLN